MRARVLVARLRRSPSARRSIGPILAVAVLLLSAGCSSTPTAPDPGAGTGRVEAQPSALDLGRVPFDVMAEGRFELVNSGGSTIHLGKPTVKTVSGC